METGSANSVGDNGSTPIPKPNREADHEGTRAGRHSPASGRTPALSMKNFQYKSFYSFEREEIFCIYRQGEVFTIKPKKLDEYKFQKIIDRDLGQMELLFD